MHLIISIATLFFLTTGCQSTGSSNKITIDSLSQKKPADTIKPETLKPYDELKYKDKEILSSAPGTKSVLFNSSGTKLYAMNLEGMSVYEFDQSSKKISREFRFTPTKGTGWDYAKSRPIPSFQEKPVEACLSHDDKILWVSLHNAGGIVPIWVDDISKNKAITNDSTKNLPAARQAKPVTVIYPENNKMDSFRVPLIETGKTPKVIAKTNDSKYLLVSNWHSKTVSILEMNEKVYPFGKIISTVPVSAIPRGIAVDNNNHKSYIAIMGGSSLAVIDNNSWQTDTILNVWSSPRHIVMDTSGHIFVSYNSLGTIACLDAKTGKSLFTASTHSQPRTIVLSKNHKFIFVTCYTGDMVDVYKINPDNFEKIASLPCAGHPVGVDVFEDNEKLEAWVCSYGSGSISVYSFKKK